MQRSRLVIFLFIVWSWATLSAQNPSALWEKSLECFDKEDYFNAIHNLNLFLDLYPKNKNAISNRGLARMRMGDLEGACADFKLAASLGYKKKKNLSKYLCDPNFRLKFIKKQFYKKEELYPQFGNRPRYTMKDTLRGALRFERECYDVSYYDLSVRIIPNKKRLQGSNEIFFLVLEESNRIQIDLFANMRIDSILHKGRRLAYERVYDAVFVQFPDPLAKGGVESIEVHYSGKPRKAVDPPWNGGLVWGKDQSGNHFVGVACEQLGASVWWPTKDHLYDRVDSMSIHIEVPIGYFAVSNGVLEAREVMADNYERFSWQVSYPINNYNASFYMGKYVHFQDSVLLSEGTLKLDYYVLPKNLAKAEVHFEQTKPVLEYYDSAFGAYPFMEDGFKLVESPYEGMEHQTAIAYGSSFSNAKNSEEYLNKQFDYIIVHEAAHEWWGNAVTIADMADAWIHEGFATYSEYLFLEDTLGYQAAIEEAHHHFLYIMNIWPLVQNRDVNEDSFAGGDIYLKGAAVLQGLRSSMNNDSLFFTMLKDFNMQNRENPLNSEAFVEHVNRYTSDDYRPFFNKYLHDTDLPVLQYSYEKTDRGILLKYKWGGVEAGFKMPFAIRLDENESLRIEADTEFQETLLKDAGTFLFYNMSTDLQGIPHNALTYHHTRCIDY